MKQTPIRHSDVLPAEQRTLLSDQEINRIVDIVTERVMTAIDAKLSTRQDEERLYSRQEFADLLGCAPSTLWRWEQEGLLSATRIGGRLFYSKADIFDKQLLQKKRR